MTQDLLSKSSDLLVGMFRIAGLRNPNGAVFGSLFGAFLYGAGRHFGQDPTVWFLFPLGILIVNFRGFLQTILGDDPYDEELRRKLAIVKEYKRQRGNPEDVRRLYFEIAKTEVERRSRPVIIERPGASPEEIEPGRGNPMQNQH